MTNDERIKSILSEIEYDYIGYDSLHGDDGQGMRIIKDALQKAYKYRWHDLRKNPDDLPEQYENCEICFICCKNKCYHTAYLNEDYVWELPMDGSPNETLENVIAWREIEPFEEEEIND